MKNKQPLSSVIHTMNTNQKNFFFWVIMLDLFKKHPFPWKQEKDWSSEIHDANNLLVIKFSSTEHSLEFIKFAEDLKKENDLQLAEVLEEFDETKPNFG
jgi:hypothetical protein